MTPQESFDGIIAGLRCGICPERKMRENPCPVCTGKYAAIERVRALFKAAEWALSDLEEHVEDGECAGPNGTARRGSCSLCRPASYLAKALRGAT
jgi:hypothetical protein